MSPAAAPTRADRSRSKTTGVLVVGAGPVGLMMAAELLRHGVRCRIIDPKEGPTVESRALGIQPRTLEVFESIGIVEEVLAQGRRVSAINAYDRAKRVAHINFDLEGPETRYPFVLVLPQSRTEQVLIDLLGRRGGAVEWRTTLKALQQDEQGDTATLVDAQGSEQSARFDWIIGCDGAHSTVRHQLEIPFNGAAYEESFLLADVRLDWDLSDRAVQILLTSQGAVPAFPFPEAGRWRLVDTSGAVQTDDASLIVDRFRAVLRANGHERASLSDPTWVSHFRIHRRVAAQLRQGRCFLAGDAAHIHSPAGGQGMNTGLQDAFNLAWKLGLVCAGAASEKLLDSYSAERRPVVKKVVRNSGGLTFLVTRRNSIVRALRNRVVSFVSGFESVQRKIARSLFELHVQYHKSPIVGEYRSFLLRDLVPFGSAVGLPSRLAFRTGPRPGDRVPEVLIGTESDDGPKRLHEVLRSTRHLLFLFEGENGREKGLDELKAVANLVRMKYRDHIDVVFIPQPDTERDDIRSDVRQLLDPEGRLHHRFGARSRCLYLIRPDGYIGYRSQPANQRRLEKYLQRIFI